MSPLTRPRTTVCLLNWKRPENISAVIRSVSSQVPRPDVFLWNNGPDIESEGVDWYVRSSLNKRCWPRWFMARHAETEFVCVLDDDVAFGDMRVLQDMVDLLVSQGSQRTIVGPCGVTLRDGVSYKAGDHVHPFRGGFTDGRCDVIKGKCMLLWRDAVSSIEFPEDLNEDCDDDIVVSALIARGRRGQHICAASLGPRFDLLPEPYALKNQPEHWQRRTACCNRYFDLSLPLDA